MRRRPTHAGDHVLHLRERVHFAHVLATAEHVYPDPVTTAQIVISIPPHLLHRVTNLPCERYRRCRTPSPAAIAVREPGYCR